MANYKNGKIYKLINNEMPDKIYYGSTIQTLKKRLYKHKYDVERRNQSSKQLFEYGEVEIILIEKFPCNTKEELWKREGEFIKNNKCINKLVAGRTKKEWVIDNINHLKSYRENYYKDNKNKIIERVKEHSKIRIICECGSDISKPQYKRHTRSKKHINYINSKK